MKKRLSTVGFAAAYAAVLAKGDQAASVLPARDEAQGYFDNDEARKGLATLAEAARQAPADRMIGAMLYTAIRDHAWHFSQILPIRHMGVVRVLAFSPDGTRLASGSDNGEVFVSPTEPLDAAAAAKQRLTIKEPDGIVGLAFTKDGTRLAVASKAGWIRVWDLVENKVTFTAPRADMSTTAFAAAKSGDLAAVGMENGTIQIVDVMAGKVAAEIKQPAGKVLALAFSQSGEKLAAACGNGSAFVSNARTGSRIGGILHQGGGIDAIDFSRDGRYVATGGNSGKVDLWNPEAKVLVSPEMDCGAPVKKISISPDGSLIAALLDDESVQFWDAVSGEKISFDVRGDAPFNDMKWSRSGLRIATASQAGSAALWTMYDGRRNGEPMPHEGAVIALALSENSKLLASGGVDGLARVWRTDDGMPLPTVRNHVGRARTAFYSQDGHDLITASEDHTALHWISGQIEPFGPALKHRGKVTCAVFNTHATLILTCDDSGIAQLWDAKTGRPAGDPYRHHAAVNWVDFHPDGKRLVTVAGPAAYIWSVADREKPLAVIQPPGGGKSVLKCARFSPDGKRLVTASSDGTARVWDATTYQPTGEIIDRKAPVLCVRFSPDGSLLVVCGQDSQAAVYDTATWKQTGVPVIAPGSVFSAFITPDNRFMGLCAYLLNAVQFFEIKTGSPLGEGFPIESQPTCVDFLARDKVIAVACDDGTVCALDSPFVDQDVPAWICDFAERIGGLKRAGEDSFNPVDSNYNELPAFITPAAQADNLDFSRLAQWRLQSGERHPGMPRFTSTLAANIEHRVDERSVPDVMECFDALPGDPLILGALSLYWPNPRHSEYLADLALGMPDASPLARCFAASALINAGRSDEARAAVNRAVAEAPNDFRVLRRAAKFAARTQDEDLSMRLFEKTLRLDPNDFETRRSYAWALYDFERPEEAAAQFHLAEEAVGEMDDDLIAGLCLCAAMEKNESEARMGYARLVALDSDWEKEAYLRSLRGWTAVELSALEKIRSALYPAGGHQGVAVIPSNPKIKFP